MNNYLNLNIYGCNNVKYNLELYTNQINVNYVQ